jgi:tetratricopeptide (TPR) repeat protein
MLSRWQGYRFAGLLMLGVLLLTVPFQQAVHRERPDLFDPKRRIRQVSRISIGPTPAVIAALGGFRTVAADLLWLKVERVWDGGDWWQILPLLDVVTQLDPHFLLAWQVYGWHAAYNLHAAAELKSEKKQYLEKGIQIFERAVEANPNTWEMYFQLGWTLYDRAHENWRAAEYFRKADQFPDAPAYVTRMYFRCFEHVMDFERLFPALEYAKRRHTDANKAEDVEHQFIVNRDYKWWKERWNDPQEHRRQIVIENSARQQRSLDYYLYPDDPYWEVCPFCGMPSPKGSAVCQNPLCKHPFPGRERGGRGTPTAEAG